MPLSPGAHRPASAVRLEHHKGSRVQMSRIRLRAVTRSLIGAAQKSRGPHAYSQGMSLPKLRCALLHPGLLATATTNFWPGAVLLGIYINNWHYVLAQVRGTSARNGSSWTSAAEQRALALIDWQSPALNDLSRLPCGLSAFFTLKGKWATVTRCRSRRKQQPWRWRQRHGRALPPRPHWRR